MTSMAARAAVVGLLTLSTLLVPRGSVTSALDGLLAGTRVFASAVEDDLDRVQGELAARSPASADEDVEAEVADAVASARAAATAASAALDEIADDAAPFAAVALADAQVALEAAAAQVDHVRRIVDDPAVAATLAGVRAHLDTLRLGD